MAFILPRTEKTTEPPSYDEIAKRISTLGFYKIREFGHDYRDECVKRIKADAQMPFSFREWLHDRIADLLIVESHEHNRSWY